MRIRNPPKFIMSISLIMSLIMTLLVFQCDRRLRRTLAGTLAWKLLSLDRNRGGSGRRYYVSKLLVVRPKFGAAAHRKVVHVGLA